MRSLPLTRIAVAAAFGGLLGESRTSIEQRTPPDAAT
jgi:hypothetical protein